MLAAAPFTVKVGAIVEATPDSGACGCSDLLIASSKKGISSNQLHRTLGVTLKTAWFMSHRIREAMSTGGGALFGQGGGGVEMDETYIGRASRARARIARATSEVCRFAPTRRFSSGCSPRSRFARACPRPPKTPTPRR